MAINRPSSSSLQSQIGQMLIFGWQSATASESLTVNSHALALIDDLAVGGVILMGRNVDTPDQVRRLTDELQARNGSHGRPPLFVAVDQEGGRVNRLNPPNFAVQPSAKEIGDTGDPKRARTSAAAIASELKSVGINFDFAPVLDVNNNPKNPVIGNRSYGDDPARVAEMGVAAVRGFQEDGGIMACGKHFPGHGDTDVDSHLALPVVPHDRTRMDAVELVPFRSAVEAGVAAIMTSHILFTALDSDRPATMSPAILTGLLRSEMGFDGLIVTDCLEMKGVAVRWGSAEAAVCAVEAGADILLCCHTLATQIAIRDAVLNAVQSGRIPESRIAESVERIESVKSRWLT